MQQLVSLLDREGTRPGLAHLILETKKSIIDEFLKAANECVPGIKKHSKIQIMDALPELLVAMAHVLKSDSPTLDFKPLSDLILKAASRKDCFEKLSTALFRCRLSSLWILALGK